MKYIIYFLILLVVIVSAITIDRSMREKPEYYLEFYGAYNIYYIESTEDNDDYVLYSEADDVLYVGSLSKCYYYMSVLSSEPVEKIEEPAVAEPTFLPL